MLRETEKLLLFIDTAEVQDAYNEELFISFVNSIIVYSRDSVGFKLKCGLTLKEALCTGTRSEYHLQRAEESRKAEVRFIL